MHPALPATAALAALLLTACGRDPTLLEDMGDVDVVVAYNAANGAGPGATDVYLYPAEGCPTFVGDATLDGEPMDIEEPGRTDHGSYYFFPTTTCLTPHFTLGAPRGGDGESLSVVLTDDSSTWEVATNDAFGFGYTGPATLTPGADATLVWEGPAAPEYVFVEAWRGELGVYVPYAVEADGDVILSVPPALTSGPLRLTIGAFVPVPADTCAGFAACELSADYGATLDVAVE